MLRIENAVVRAMAKGDVQTALSHLRDLVVRDRRRCWWAVFRVALAQQPQDRRQAMIAIVGKAYIARRTGFLVGTSETDLLISLLVWTTAQDLDPVVRGLNGSERRLLQRWLPGRLKAIAREPTQPS